MIVVEQLLSWLKNLSSEFVSQWILHYWGLMSDLAKLSKIACISLSLGLRASSVYECVSTFLLIFLTLSVLFYFFCQQRHLPASLGGGGGGSFFFLSSALKKNWNVD